MEKDDFVLKTVEKTMGNRFTIFPKINDSSQTVMKKELVESHDLQCPKETGLFLHWILSGSRSSQYFITLLSILFLVVLSSRWF